MRPRPLGTRAQAVGAGTRFRPWSRVSLRPEAEPPADWERLAGLPAPPGGAAFAVAPAGGRYSMRFAGGPAFVIGTDRVDVFAFAGLRPEELRWYLLGPVAAFLLRLRGRLLLHAAAVRVDGCTVALAGPSGAGKSTLAAALVARGGHGVSDDLLVLERSRGVAGRPTTAPGWQIHPGPPRHLLWPDAASRIARPAGASHPSSTASTAESLPANLPPNPCRWDKRSLEPPRWIAPAATVPLSRLLLLVPDAAGAEPVLRPCRLGRVVAALVASLHAGWFGDAERRRLDLDGIADLVGDVAVAELVVPRDFARLPEVAALVEATLVEAAEIEAALTAAARSGAARLAVAAAATGRGAEPR